MLKKRRILFAFLRLLTFLFLVIVLLRPEYNIREKPSTKSVLAVLLDNSESMGLNDPSWRWKRVKNFFSQEPFKKLEKEYQIKHYTFSDRLSSWDGPPSPEFWRAGNLAKFPLPLGKVTNISQALEEAKKIENLQGVIMITDGQYTQGDNPLNLFALPPEISGKGGLGPPVYSIGVGVTWRGIKDLAIEEIKHSDFAFKNIPVEIEVEISGYGFEGKEIPANLSEKLEEPGGSQIVQTQNARIDSQGKAKVKFTFTPQNIGEKVYTVALPTYKEEVSLTNNRKEFLLPVMREKIRILYLCGQANHEYAFLRAVLKNDPTIELVSFVILRNPENIALFPDDQLSLIPFPAHEIFVKELYNYDLVIIENFTYHRFGILSQYLDNLRNFVNRGGGLIMLGGDNAFGRGGYKGTAIEEILPVEIFGPHEEKIIPGLFQMEAENYDHPLVNLGATLSETRNIWREMPEVDSFNKLGKAKSGATVLAVHPREKSPILACWDKGKGRVLVLTTNTTWRWAMGLAREGKAPEIYARFWQGAIRWLTHAEEMKRVRLLLEKKSFRSDEKIFGRIRVYDENYRPLKGVEMRFFLTSQEGRKVDLSKELKLAPEAETWVEVIPKHIGKYSAKVEVWHNKRFYGEDEVSFQVYGIGEKDHFNLNEDLLRNLSAISGGKYFSLEELETSKVSSLAEIMARLVGSPKEAQTRIRKKIEIWNQPYLYLLVVLFLGLEWYLRRKSGLL